MKEGKWRKSIRCILCLLGILMAAAAGYLLGTYHERQQMEKEVVEAEQENEKGDIRKETVQEPLEQRGKEVMQEEPEDQEFLEKELVQEPMEQAKETEEEAMDREISQILEQMTLEEKVSQIFFITPEALTGADAVTAAGEITKNAFWKYPVGGICYFRQNILSEEQFAGMVTDIQRYSEERTGLPLLIGVDEEGGTVSRITGRGFPNVPEIPDMLSVGETGNPQKAYEIGSTIGQYLKRFQVNVDFAPIADVFTNPDNTVIGNRAFAREAETAALMVEQEVRGLNDQKIAAALKHFPGHGDTAQDSHDGMAVSTKTLDELRACELIPFQRGIESGAQFVMTGHISCPQITGSDVPASLSEQIVTDLLREEMGFEGIVVTDAMNMGAIVNRYSSAEAAVMAIQAGVDMILMPGDFYSAWDGVMQAVKSGQITEERIEESVRRILELKKNI